MNTLLWILQIALALLFLSGGAYKLSSRGELASHIGSLSRGSWGVIGVLEIVGAVLLVVPAAFGWMSDLTILAAGVLTVESVVLSAVYARASRTLSASNPLVWSAVMGTVAAIVFYGRLALSPLT
jgi:hypothetical protein